MVAVGVEDGSFESFQRGAAQAMQHTFLCLSKLKGSRIQDIKLTRVTVDGLDATDELLKNLFGWEYDVIILGGATFAGFNVVDVQHVCKFTERPVIVFSPKMPDINATLNALRKHFTDWKIRWSRYEKLGELHELVIENYQPIYYEVVGESTSFAEKILKEQTIISKTPEAIRVADLVAKGVSSIFQDLKESRCEFLS